MVDNEVEEELRVDLAIGAPAAKNAEHAAQSIAKLATLILRVVVLEEQLDEGALELQLPSLFVEARLRHGQFELLIRKMNGVAVFEVSDRAAVRSCLAHQTILIENKTVSTLVAKLPNILFFFVIGIIEVNFVVLGHRAFDFKFAQVCVSFFLMEVLGEGLVDEAQFGDVIHLTGVVSNVGHY